MKLFKKTLYFCVLIFFCLCLANAAPRMAHQKDLEELKWRPVVMLPPLPRLTQPPVPANITTTGEPLAKEVRVILSQLKDSEVLKDRKKFNQLLHQLKSDFPVSTVPPTTRSFTPV